MSRTDPAEALFAAIDVLSGQQEGDAEAAYASLESALEAGCDPDVRNDRGMRPIDLLARGTDSVAAGDAAFRLVQAGADAKTPASMQECAPLHAAAFYGLWRVTEALLEAGVDPNGPSNGSLQKLMKGTPLHALAAGFRSARADEYAECFKLLLRYQADVDKTDRRNQKPLDIAVQAAAGTGDRTLVDAMLEYGVQTAHDTTTSARNVGMALSRRNGNNRDLPAMMAKSHMLALARQGKEFVDQAIAKAEADGEDPDKPIIINKHTL